MNNVGIGAQSQIWSHVKFGDRAYGCRWYSESETILEDDVWIVGHCIVSPIVAESRSMAMVGSVVTKDMKHNRVYAGVPAVDITDKVGPQFDEHIKPEETYDMVVGFLKEYESLGNDISFVRVCDAYENLNDAYTYLNVRDRTYIPRRTEEEYRLMKYLLYEKAKFLPCEV
jgi:hypothetical protein